MTLNRILAACLASATLSAPALADTWPSKPITRWDTSAD